MGDRRSIGPAAVAAALIGAGLLLHRPRLVPELKAGPRADARREPALAAAIAWPPRPSAATAAPHPGGASSPEPDAEKIVAWRDALADRPFSAVERDGASPRLLQPPRGPSAAPPGPAPGAGPRPARSLHDAVVALLRAAMRRERAAAAPRRRISGPVPAAKEAHRAPLALGPAGPGDADEDGADASAVDPRGRGEGRSEGSWSRRRARSFPLFRPPRPGPSRRDGARARRRTRPLLLSRLLGPGPLRPPPAALIPPDLSGLDKRKPARLPDGSPAPSRPFGLDLIEGRDPRRGSAADRRRKPHWDGASIWHDGAAQGVSASARWLWLWKEKARWWAVGEPEASPLLRHRNLWWSKRRGVWFALHDGELWSWRRFSDWDAEGLIRLTDGVELVYSSDFTKVAVITPGAGAVLYDANTGAELGEWLESEMPRRRPRAPAGLRLPRGI